MNVQKIRNFLENWNTKEVGIFSFAIWNEKDKEDFDKFGIKNIIEAELRVKIDQVLTVPEIAKEIFWKQGMVISVNEFITIWGKQRAFTDWALLQPTPVNGDEIEFILIDDVVQPMTINVGNFGGIRIKLINVNQI